MGGRRAGSGGGPYLPDCCSPHAFTATAWPIQPADLIPSSLCIAPPPPACHVDGMPGLHLLGTQSRDARSLNPEHRPLRLT